MGNEFITNRLRNKIAEILHFSKFEKDGEVWYDDDYTSIYSESELDEVIKRLDRAINMFSRKQGGAKNAKS